MSENGTTVLWPERPERMTLPPAVPGQTLAAQLARAGLPLNTRCGGHGRCAGCTVALLEGEFVDRSGNRVIAPAPVKACQGSTGLAGSAVVSVPARAVAAHRPQVVSTFKAGVLAAHCPRFPNVAGASDHGLAIDIGTTTVVVSLVELATGNIVREEAGFNRQVEFGEDVATRIQVSAHQLGALHEAVVHRTLDSLIAAVVGGAGLSPERIAGLVVVGNTTMLHLLTRTDPGAMGVAPFRPAFIEARELTAGEIGFRALHSSTPVHLLPGFSAYVGADLVAGAACTGLLHEDGPSLLVDIGTNGEILLKHEERIYATATAAGPAFEGGSMRCGTRAVAGAVAHVRFSDGPELTPEVDVIPGAATIAGVCGSAFVDLLAAARRCRLLNEAGRFDPETFERLAAPHRYREGAARGVRLVAQSDAAVVMESDIAHLLQAKSAIAAGILTLLRRRGLEARDVQTLHLAGGFGLHVDVENAIACGLLPGFSPRQVNVVGNTALGGAWLAMVDRTLAPELDSARLEAEIVELNLDPGFEDTFIDCLALP